MRYRKWGGFLLALTLAAMLPTFAKAITIDTVSTTIAANYDSPQNLIVYRDVTGVKNYVDTSFKYSLTEDSSNPAPVNNMPTGDSTLYVSGAPNEDNTVSGLMSIRLSDLEFTELGDYKFVLREIYSADPDNYPIDDSHEYYVYVSVRNELLAGVPTGNMVATLLTQVRNHDEGAKSQAKFSSEAVRTYLELSKSVTGSLANTNEYFKFLVTINGRAGDEYTITGQDESVTYNGETITPVSTFVIGESGVEVYMRHGQTITIGHGEDGLDEVPINAEYVIEEIGAEDYMTTVDGSAGKITSTKRAAVLLEDDSLPDANQTIFVNHKESAVMTGITLAIIPAAILIVAMFTGAVIVRKVKKDSVNKR